MGDKMSINFIAVRTLFYPVYQAKQAINSLRFFAARASLPRRLAQLIPHTSYLIPFTLLLTACAQSADPTPTLSPLPTLVASLTSTPPSTAQVVVETPPADATAESNLETPEVITVEPLLGQAIEPPLDITLPQGWAEQMNDTLLLTDVDAMRPIPFVVWSGPVTGGMGRIVLLWGYPSVSGGNPFDAPLQTPAPDPWSDGLRLLRLAIVDQGCNIGTDLRRDYRVGLLPAQGTQFSAVDCPATPDTRGWFAGLYEGGLNFVFFVFTDPIEAMTAADEELQAILDTVRFAVPELP
jgi:hypothetical protein